jgi:hypothetical protein
MKKYRWLKPRLVQVIEYLEWTAAKSPAVRDVLGLAAKSSSNCRKARGPRRTLKLRARAKKRGSGTEPFDGGPHLSSYFKPCHHSRKCAHAWPLKEPLPWKSRTSFCQGSVGGVVSVSGLSSTNPRKGPLVAVTETFQIFRLDLSWCFPLDCSVHE